MSSQTAARRYASALADVIIKGGEERAIRGELDGWERMISASDALLEAFGNPTVAYEQKQSVLEELITRTKIRLTTANFLRILLKNQRLAELPQINARLDQIVDERMGVVSAEVTSARPISDATKIALGEKLTQLTGKKARLSFHTDESLLGGIVTRIGSTIYDGSIRNELNRLRDQLAG